MAEMQDMHPEGAVEQSSSVGAVINLLGAAASLALIVGVGVWGYKLMVRDVSGVPVVRAAEGPMRVQPDSPGGQQALHQGLSVNDVAAEGTAADPADRLILAPEPLTLTLDDRPRPRALEDDGETRTAESGEAAGEEPEAMRLAAVEALADRIADGVSPLTPQDPVEEAVQAALSPAPAPTVEGGLGRSLRPKLRPASLTAGAEVEPSDTAGGVQDVDPETIPVGTRLAQLGAFGSREIAIKEWNKLAENFGDYLEGKDRVIEKATSGGRTFYRLRAMGFDDLSDARRFCSALVAERAECIPVVTR